MDNFIPVENTIKAINQLFHTERERTKFDKSIDLIKTLACTTIPGVIGQLLETSIKTFQVLQNDKQKVEFVKYVSDMYEVQCLSEIEMKKLEVQSKDQINLSLFLEKTLQLEIDKISKEHLCNMKKIDNIQDNAIYEIDNYVKIKLHQIDKNYALIISENEAKLFLYRQFMQYMFENSTTPADLLVEASRVYFSIVKQAYTDGNGNSPSTIVILNNLMEFIKCMGSTNIFISFNDFIEHKKNWGERLV